MRAVQFNGVSEVFGHTHMAPFYTPANIFYMPGIMEDPYSTQKALMRNLCNIINSYPNPPRYLLYRVLEPPGPYIVGIWGVVN